MKKTKFKLILNSNSYRIYTDNRIEYCRFKKKYYPLNEIENVINSYKIGGVVAFNIDSSTNIINPIFDAIYLRDIGLIWKKITLKQIINTENTDDKESTNILLYRLNINGFNEITCPNFNKHFHKKASKTITNNTNSQEMNVDSQDIFKETVRFTDDDEIMRYWFYHIFIKINSYVVITDSKNKCYIYTPYIDKGEYINIHNYKKTATETSKYNLANIFKNNILNYKPDKTPPNTASGNYKSNTNRLNTASTKRRPPRTASGNSTPDTTSTNKKLEEYLQEDSIDLHYKIFLCYLKYFKDELNNNDKLNNLELKLLDILNNPNNIFNKYIIRIMNDENIKVSFSKLNVETIVVNVLRKLDPSYLAHLLKEQNINIFAENENNENLFTYYLQKCEIEDPVKEKIEKYISTNTKQDKFIEFNEFLIYNDPTNNTNVYDFLINNVINNPGNKLRDLNIDKLPHHTVKSVLNTAIKTYKKNKIILTNFKKFKTVILITKKLKTDINTHKNRYIDINKFANNLKNTIENFLSLFVKSASFYKKFKNQQLNNILNSIFDNLERQVNILDEIFDKIKVENYSNNFKSAIVNYCISKPDELDSVIETLKELQKERATLETLINNLNRQTILNTEDPQLNCFIKKVFPKIHCAKSFIRDDLIDNIQNLISNCSEYNKIIKDIKNKCNITDINKKLEQDKLILKTLNTTLYNTTTIIKEFLKLIKSNNVYTDDSKVYLMQIQAPIENYIKELNKIKNIKVLLSIGTILDNEKFRSCSEYNEILELIKVNKNINETHYLKFENLLDIEQKTLIEILLDIVKVIENKNSNDENSLLMLQKYKNDDKLNDQFKNIRRDFFGIGDKLSNSVPPQTIEATGPVLKITQDQKAVEAAELKAVGAAAAKKKEEEAKAIAKQKVKAIPQSGSLTQKEPLPPQIIEATSPSGSLTQKEPLPPQIIEATSPSASLTQKEPLPPQIIEATSPSASLTQKQILPQSNETTDKSQIIEATSPSASLTQKQIQPPQAEPIQSKKELPITESIELAEKIIELLKKEEIPTIYAYYFYSNKKNKDTQEEIIKEITNDISEPKKYKEKYQNICDAVNRLMIYLTATAKKIQDTNYTDETLCDEYNIYFDTLVFTDEVLDRITKDKNKQELTKNYIKALYKEFPSLFKNIKNIKNKAQYINLLKTQGGDNNYKTAIDNIFNYTESSDESDILYDSDISEESIISIRSDYSEDLITPLLTPQT